MNGYIRDKTYDDVHKIVEYSPTFNSTTKLEFNILVGNIFDEFKSNKFKYLAR